jgi:hypothetical protein
VRSGDGKVAITDQVLVAETDAQADVVMDALVEGNRILTQLAQQPQTIVNLRAGSEACSQPASES